ncbi:MAG TPA: 4Fe-4S dicluster domain-containing protein [Gemmatimonadaceae bacterium]|nr:4Fe-4S dicluster domain-containing protein [Gemmatimonadaceae bacterium]
MPMRSHDAVPTPGLDRREFLRLAGASIALAGLDGCSRMPAEHILPYVDSRPELTPGVPQFYATAMCVDGFATGLLVESHDGRPTKIEGNPAHPASLGATSPIHQASVLQLYDPDRARAARIGARRTTWAEIAATLAPAALRARVGSGAGMRLLIAPTSSPLHEALLARVLQAYPEARIHMYAPLAPDAGLARTVPHYDLSRANVLVAIDSDFLASGPFHLRYARQFADNRRLASPSAPMNRLYAIESTVSPTGAAADQRFAVRPREIGSIVQSLLTAVRGGGAAPGWVAAIARDLAAHRGQAVVIAGSGLAEADRRAIDEINAALGATGTLAWYAPSPLLGGSVALHPFGELVAALHARTVDTLIVVGGNPSYATPAALEFSSLMRAVPNAGYLGPYENETARDARWFVPESHYLESWSDARAYDGTLSIVQPLVQPLYPSITAAELYAALGGTPANGAYDLLRQSWAARAGANAEDVWADALRRGLVPSTAFTATASAPANGGSVSPPAGEANATPAPGTLDVIYTADVKVHDGAYANNGWLQELPHPITKLSWGNAALLGVRTAQRLGVRDGDALTLASGGRELHVAAFTVPGHAEECVTLQLGYGRDGSESMAKGVGANAYALMPAPGVRVQSGVAVRAGGTAPAFALAQSESRMTIGEPVRRATLAEYRTSPTSVGDRPGRVLSLYPEPAPPGGEALPNQWAMTIDLGTCIGCGACVVACQAENNIPVVGAEEVRNARLMQWIRIDRYFAERENHDGDMETLFQPMLCQQCEHAPCEYVCPVEATVHSADGLNEMIYNRCVGTRFCSNNCPYKVRHFNWYDYNAHLSETELMVKNPDVTVRERGVMEKCTFCVQRIREAEIAAERDGRALRGSEVQTACQQACPTRAITFGSLTERDAEMMKRRQQPRAYSALRELGTEPRVRYLARVRNPNPDAEPTA